MHRDTPASNRITLPSFTQVKATMILLLNVFITDQGFMRYDRGLLPSSDKADIFKYSLASLSVINWSHVIVYYDLDTNYQHRRSEIDQYIGSMFPDSVVYSFRNERQSQWRIAVQELLDIKDDDLVWFSCNHDHVFVDYETDLLGRIEARLADLTKSHQYVSCTPTHWPQLLCMGRTPPFTETGVLEENRDYFMTIWRNCDSMQIVNKNLLRYWWFEHDYGDRWMPRTDMGGGNDVISPDTACIMPYRELVRHFDGYSHVKIDINACPPLFIPDGFFDHEIRISYCSDTRRKGYVSVNPHKKNHTTVDRKGADLKCVLEDLPLFWRSRIAQVEVARHIDKELLLRRRNEAVLKMAWAWQKIQLPIGLFGVALRFNDPQNVSREMRSLERFARSYSLVMNVKGKLASLVRGLTYAVRRLSRIRFRSLVRYAARRLSRLKAALQRRPSMSKSINRLLNVGHPSGPGGRDLVICSSSATEPLLLQEGKASQSIDALLPVHLSHARGVSMLKTYEGCISMVRHQQVWRSFSGIKYDTIVAVGEGHPRGNADIICIGAYLDSDRLFYLGQSGEVQDISPMRSRIRQDFRRQTVTWEPLDCDASKRFLSEVNRHYINQVVDNRYLLPHGEHSQGEALEHFRLNVGLAQDLILRAPALYGDPSWCIQQMDDGTLVDTTDHNLVLANFLSLIPNVHSVLDVGCGPGFLALHLAARDKFERIAGVDAVGSRIEGAKLLADLSGLSCEFSVMSADALGFPDKSFDVVVTSYALEQCKEILDRAMDEIFRVARRFVVLVEPSSEFAPTLPGIVHIWGNGYPTNYGDMIIERARPFSVRLPLFRHYGNPGAMYVVNMQSQAQPHILLPHLFNKHLMANFERLGVCSPGLTPQR